MSRKSEILAELARSRAAIARDSESVRSQIDVAERFRISVRSRPLAWLGGAAAIGYIFAGPKTRTKTVTKVVRGDSKPKPAEKRPRGIWDIIFALLKLAIPLVRPALSAYAAKRFADFAEKLGR
jgi:hypothetical protein